MGAALAMKYFQDTFHTGLSGQKVSVVTSLYTVYVFLLQYTREPTTDEI